MGNISTTLRLAIIEKDCKGSVTEELEGVSGFERSNVVVAKGQLIGHSNHTTSTNGVAKLGRHKEEGLRVGNQKLQLPE